MATEQAASVPTETGSLTKWASWLAALVGLWVLVSPFVLSGPFTSGTAMWSNVVAGIVVFVLAAFAAYELRTAVPGSEWSEWSGWLAALAGLWILASPFVLTGSITAGNPMYSNVAAGIVAAALAAYAGYGVE